MEEGKQINHGLNWKLEKEQQSDKDWVFGAVSPVCIAEKIPPLEREKCLPVGEIQRGQEDMMDCATRSAINILETKFNWLVKNKKISKPTIEFLENNGFIDSDGVKFSDAFIAIKSGTTRQGNSLKAPLEAIRKFGLIPKKMLPLEKSMTWEEYHNPERIVDSLINLGQESLKYIAINYEQVYEKDMDVLLERDMLDVAGYAWPDPVNEEYPRVSYQPNHAFMGIRKPMTYIFDNYLDREIEGDFIKKLASNYDFLDYGYRLIITEKKKEEEKSWWRRFLNWVKQWLS